MERVRRRHDTAYGETIVNPDAYGPGSRAMQDQRAALRRERVRLVCAPCGSRIDFIRHVDLAYRIHEGRSDFDERGQLILASSKTWRCRCGQSDPVTLERMRVEYRRALAHGGPIMLPLPRL